MCKQGNVPWTYWNAFPTPYLHMMHITTDNHANLHFDVGEVNVLRTTARLFVMYAALRRHNMVE